MMIYEGLPMRWAQGVSYGIESYTGA